MKFSLTLTTILSHSFLIALVNLLPLFQPAVIVVLTLEVVGIIIFCQQSRYSSLSLSYLVGLVIALVIGV